MAITANDFWIQRKGIRVLRANISRASQAEMYNAAGLQQSPGDCCHAASSVYLARNFPGLIDLAVWYIF